MTATFTHCGPCNCHGCECKVYSAPGLQGGNCANCHHANVSHAIYCAECHSPIFDVANSLELFCLDHLCNSCAKKHGTENILCPKCFCMTARKPFQSKIKLSSEDEEQSLETRFKQTAMKLTLLSKKPSDNILLQIYSLYKQATIGDCNTKKPGMLDPAGRAKWDAWNGKKGMGKDEAMQLYINIYDSLRE